MPQPFSIDRVLLLHMQTIDDTCAHVRRRRGRWEVCAREAIASSVLIRVVACCNIHEKSFLLKPIKID